MKTHDIDTNTVSITDYELVASKVARVVIAFTGQHTTESLTVKLGAKLKHAAAPVENSFRMVRAGVAVGFVRAHTPVRVVDNSKELSAYTVMASNILMNKADETLWELKEGASGKYLARHGNEDLSELVESATARRSDVPRLAQLAKVTAAPKEFVAFASANGDMDYGFCVASAKDRISVVSVAQRSKIDIPLAAIASVISVKIPRKAHDRITAAGVSREDVKQSIDYYTRLYSYDPAYKDEVIRQVEESAAL